MRATLYLCLFPVFHNILAADQRVHLAIQKRGGRLATHEAANLSHLAQLAQNAESRYDRSQRDIQGNKIARKWKSRSSIYAIDEDLLQEPGHAGRWSFSLPVGTPNEGTDEQFLEVDVDMLGSDFYILQTTSDKGSKYNSFASTSHGTITLLLLLTSTAHFATVSNDKRVHALCSYPADVFHFNQHSPRSISFSTSLGFAMCSPSKSSSFTLLASGAVLGLGPSAPSLSRVAAPNLLQQLSDKSIIRRQIWSVTLLDADAGILSLGATIAHEIEEARIRGEVELENMGRAEATLQFLDEEVTKRLSAFPRDTEAQFRWVSLRGATGWWTPLLSGIWVNGAKILKNQPVLLDIQSPFILGPSLAVRRFYDAIGGSRRLPVPYERFFAYPCLNKVNIAFEFAGWMFPALQGETRADVVYGPPGGPLSLGLLGKGTGYCVGAVVESGDSDLEDAWVLGEPFFRGMGIAFDSTNQLLQRTSIYRLSIAELSLSQKSNAIVGGYQGAEKDEQHSSAFHSSTCPAHAFV